jgi:hypothetical protein
MRHFYGLRPDFEPLTIDHPPTRTQILIVARRGAALVCHMARCVKACARATDGPKNRDETDTRRRLLTAMASGYDFGSGQMLHLTLEPGGSGCPVIGESQQAVRDDLAEIERGYRTYTSERRQMLILSALEEQ